MSNSGNHNSGTVAPKAFGVSAAESRGNAVDTPATTRPIRHVYVHIPFCARICPYCAFYKDLLDRSRPGDFVKRFCASWNYIKNWRRRLLAPSINDLLRRWHTNGAHYPQLELLLRGFRDRLDLSRLEEWTIEANPGSVSTRKADLLKNRR